MISEPGRDPEGRLRGLCAIPSRDVAEVLPDPQVLSYEGPTHTAYFWYPDYRGFHCGVTVEVRDLERLDTDSLEGRLLSEVDRDSVLDHSAQLAWVSVECRDPGANPPRLPIPQDWLCEEQPDGFTHCTDPTSPCELSVYVVHPDGQTIDHPMGCIGSGL